MQCAVVGVGRGKRARGGHYAKSSCIWLHGLTFHCASVGFLAHCWGCLPDQVCLIVRLARLPCPAHAWVVHTRLDPFTFLTVSFAFVRRACSGLSHRSGVGDSGVGGKQRHTRTIVVSVVESAGPPVTRLACLACQCMLCAVERLRGMQELTVARDDTTLKSHKGPLKAWSWLGCKTCAGHWHISGG